MRPPPDTIDLFLAAAGTFAAKPAVTGVSGDTSYAALERLARRYAALFAQVDEPRVLIVLPRGPDAYAAMLGAGLAGGFYAPANEASPPDKISRIASQLQPDFLVAPPELAAALQAAAPAMRLIDPADVAHAACFEGRGSRHRIGYVIFTSGSTGLPKGVVVPRSALDHYIAWVHGSGCVCPEDRVSQFNNLAFDVSVFDIYGALGCGATLVPIGGRFDRLMPARAIAREAITVWTSVPSAIDLMLASQQLTAKNLHTVRRFTLAGEPLLRPHLEAIFAVCPHTVVQNAYGPTEATVTVSCMVMNAGNFADACERNAVSIGPATGGMHLHLAGGPDEDAGELVIIGPQLAEGYWQDPARSAAAFRMLDIDGETRRGYFTGDWMERVDGRLFFRDRIDLQVKIRGYRIELDEVAAALRQCGFPGACVFKYGDGLAALVECVAGQAFDEAAARAALASQIEAYAVPEHLVAVDRLPRNENDKVDRGAALALFEATMARSGNAQ